MTERDEVSADGGAAAGEELAALREALLRGYPETVPDLVTGASVTELLASLEPAAAAYRRVVEAAQAAASPASPAAPPVPAGNAAPIAIDPTALPATEKIRRGLAGRERGGRG
ncbi:MAG TPA: hypothetical protein VFQ80_15095 [Thermomicrobiales bacterium]|nr:hypothetical protein [Thermomicrobiales bacterium]